MIFLEEKKVNLMSIFLLYLNNHDIVSIILKNRDFWQIYFIVGLLKIVTISSERQNLNILIYLFKKLLQFFKSMPIFTQLFSPRAPHSFITPMKDWSPFTFPYLLSMVSVHRCWTVKMSLSKRKSSLYWSLTPPTTTTTTPAKKTPKK